MTVYAVNHTNDDTSAAQQWGDIKHINVRYVYGDEITDGELPGPPWQALLDAADVFEPERDFLLIVGDHLQLVQFAALLGRQYTYFKVLRWDKKAEGYIPVTIRVWV